MVLVGQDSNHNKGNDMPHIFKGILQVVRFWVRIMVTKVRIMTGVLRMVAVWIMTVH